MLLSPLAPLLLLCFLKSLRNGSVMKVTESSKESYLRHERAKFLLKATPYKPNDMRGGRGRGLAGGSASLRPGPASVDPPRSKVSTM